MLDRRRKRGKREEADMRHINHEQYCIYCESEELESIIK